ncbi:hypothetical protein [Ruegeria sp. HKCCD6604]|uniref:hypothetical protein n=1 Tax=Ruegeria sp. HKCCD6604 TaxID=2683000 RepID=UPI001C128C18|nr:hypothetical protein [Ruegeria sp. HKCCD6604]
MTLEKQMQVQAAWLLVLSKKPNSRHQIARTAGVSPSAVRRMVKAKMSMIAEGVMPSGDWMIDRDTAKEIMEKDHGTLIQ